jgi:hypothetical protein
MDSVMHLYTYEVVNLCCEVVSYSSLHGFVQWALTSDTIYLWANSQSWATSTCVCFAGCAPGAQNGLLHWQHACRLSLVMDGVFPCNPELQLPSSQPCSWAAAAGHNSDLLFLCLAMPLGCYCRLSHQPPAAGEDSGSVGWSWPPAPHDWW